jgi:hypothetical protein
MDVGHVRLGELMRKLRESGRGFKKDGQHARGQRVQGSGVAYTVRARKVSQPADDLEGRLTGGLVDVEDAADEDAIRARASLRRH